MLQENEGAAPTEETTPQKSMTQGNTEKPINQDISELKRRLPGFDMSGFKKVTAGGEYAGSCINCGGEDRCRIHTNGPHQGKMICRGCGVSMDIIDYNKKKLGKSLGELFKEYLPERSSFPQQEKIDLPTAATRLLVDRRHINRESVNVLVTAGNLCFKYHGGVPALGFRYLTLDSKEELAVQFCTLDETPFPFTSQNKPAKKVFRKGDKPGGDCFSIAGLSIDQAETIIIFEAVINAITAAENIPGACCIALGGSTYTNKLKALLPHITHIKKIIAAGDNDDAGQKLNKKIRETLGEKKVTAIQWATDDPPGCDINDLLMSGQKQRIVDLIEGALPVGEKIIVWEDVTPLDEATPPGFEDNVFPGVLGEMVQAISTHTETPFELATGLILGAVATACQGKIKICIKKGYSD